MMSKLSFSRYLVYLVRTYLTKLFIAACHGFANSVHGYDNYRKCISPVWGTIEMRNELSRLYVLTSSNRLSSV
jgi:hypothetical protein